nr:Unknown Function [uncultured bacterium]
MKGLALSAGGFASAMSRAFTQAVSGAQSLDGVLRTLALRLSSMVLTAALRPVAAGLTGGLTQAFNGLFGVAASGGGTDSGGGQDRSVAFGAGGLFTSGGAIARPPYLPQMDDTFGRAGDAASGAAVMPRRPSGGLPGSSANGAGAVIVNIATPDPDSFRRSETYLTGQIARAVARGQRSL